MYQFDSCAQKHALPTAKAPGAGGGAGAASAGGAGGGAGAPGAPPGIESLMVAAGIDASGRTTGAAWAPMAEAIQLPAVMEAPKLMKILSMPKRCYDLRYDTVLQILC